MTMTSTHHQLFDIRDVLTEIFVCLAELGSKTRGRRDLARAATCSKTLSQSALDVLWRKLDSELPLFKLLPGFQKLRDVWILADSEPIRDLDWQRFDDYASRVRSFELTTRSEKIDLSVYLRLALLKKAPLLPSLSQLVCSSPVTRLLPYLVPSLCEVTVDFVRREDKDRTFLRVLTENAPILQTLTLSGIFSTGSLGIIASCRSLRRLDLWGVLVPIDQPSFDTLSSLPQLCDLTIDLIDTSLEFLSQSAMPPFAQLQILLVSGGLPSITGFLAFIGSTYLNTLTIDSYRDNHEPGQWRRCIETLVSAPYVQSLRSIDGRVNFDLPQIHTTQMIEPLLGLTGLEDVWLQPATLPGDWQGLVDKDVTSMASAWPNIAGLAVTTSPGPNLRPTFTSLLTLALRCPHITFLKLTFDLTNLPPTTAIPILSHGLTKIDLGRSSISDSKHLVRLLDRLFPHLDCITSCDGNAMDSSRGELDDLRQLCQDIKKHAFVQLADKG